jgi:spore coat protein X
LSSKKKKKDQDKDKKYHKDHHKESRDESSNDHFHESDDHKAYYDEPKGHSGGHEDLGHSHDFMPFEEKPNDFMPFKDYSFENKPKEDKPVDHVSYGYYPEKKDSHDAVVSQDANQYAAIEQDSDELIFIKESCNICVHTTSTQATVSLQVALQLAIALVLRITIADTDKGKSVAQDLLQYFDSEQSNKQKIIIENSKDINVKTTDTDIAAHVQALLEVLLTLVAKLDVG